MTRVHKITLILILILSISVGLYTARHVRLADFIFYLGKAQISWLFVAIGCMLVYLVLEAWIVAILVNTSYKGFTLKDALQIPLVEQLFNAITPFSSGGQPAQLVALVADGVEGGKAASMMLLKFIIFQVIIVLNCFIGLCFGFKYILEQFHALSVFLLFGFFIHLVVISFLLLVMYHYKFATSLVNMIIYPLKWIINETHFRRLANSLQTQMQGFHAESLALSYNKKLIIKLGIITFFQLSIYYFIPYFIMLALGYYNVNVVVVVSLTILIVMGISLFPIPGGTGGAEYSFEAIFKNYIFNPDLLVLALILWRFITYYLGIIGGLWALTWKTDKVKNK